AAATAAVMSAASVTAAWATTTAPTTATASTIAIAATILAATIASAFRPARTSRGWFGIDTVEVRLVVGVEFSAAFDHSRRLSVCCRRSGNCVSAITALRSRRRTASHLRALLFQNCFARQLDAIAFHGQDFYQDLIAFFQLVADVFNSVFRHFADVQ